MALIRSVVTVGGYTLASRILGFVRDVAVAAVLGAGAIADAFFVALQLPNLFRRLFAEGAFSAAFVPLFSDRLARDGRAAADAFAEEALAALLAVLFVLVLAFQIAMPWAMLVLAPGFADEPQKFDLAVLFTRITFPYLLFISLVSLLSGVLNSLGRFAAAAAAPILFNLSLIAAVLAATLVFPTAGHALAWGVAAAGVAQFLWLLAACARAGVRLRLAWPRLTPGVGRLLALALPAALGAGASQINLVINQMIASFLPSGSIAYLFYADRLNQLPIGVIGVALGTALLPLLSRQIAAGGAAESIATQNRAIEFGLLFTLPATAALIVIPFTLIGVLFQRGAFGAAETAATAAALVAYAVGLPAFVLTKVLTPGFYARQDTRTPVRIAVATVACNIVLNLALIVPLAHVGLALALSLSAWLQTGLLAFVLHRRGHWRADDRLKTRGFRALLAALVMAAALLAGVEGLGPWLAGPATARAAALAILVAGGAALYGVAAHVLGAARLGQVLQQLRPRRDRPGSSAANAG